MNIAIITVNDFNFHPNKRLGEAARQRGYRIDLINPYDLVCSISKSKPGLNPDHLPDIILPRQGAPMGEYGFVVLRQFKAMGIPLVNDLEGITIARNQYITLQSLSAAGLPVPDSCFITQNQTFFKAVDFIGGYPVIVKQVDGMGGDGVVKIDTDKAAENYLEKTLNPSKGMLVQQFIPPQGRTDIRILVIGNRVAGAMALTPLSDDFRANIHQSGHAKAISLSREWMTLALEAAKTCRLDVAGVDMIVKKDGRPVLIEVNYSPGFRGLEAATGIDIAGTMMDFLTERKTPHEN